LRDATRTGCLCSWVPFTKAGSELLFEVAAVLTEVVLLANLAEEAGVGKKVEWDGPNMKCTNLPDLNRLVQHENRKGWTV